MMSDLEKRAREAIQNTDWEDMDPDRLAKRVAAFARAEVARALEEARNLDFVEGAALCDESPRDTVWREGREFGIREYRAAITTTAALLKTMEPDHD